MFGKRASKEQVWNLRDYCSFDHGGKILTGKIRKLRDDEGKVKADNGIKYWVPFEMMRKPNDEMIRRLTDRDADDEEEKEDEEGFSQYPINWDKDKINFAFKTKGIRFVGSWRKRALNSFAVDMYAIMSDGKEMPAESITYFVDPRDNIRSLNSDICAAANKWFHINEVKDSTTIEGLRKKAETPVLTIKKLRTFDNLLLQFKEFRDTAIRCGGTRHFTFQSDEPSDPKISIKVNFTDQAMALQGKVPNLYQGAVFDQIKGKRGEGKGDKIQFKGDPSNIKDLKEHLAKAKEKGDKKEQRKIRAALRKMGHRGGGRS